MGRITGGLTVLAKAVAATLVFLVVVAVVLVATNPDPREALGWERLADVPQPVGEVAATALSDPDRLVVAGGFAGGLAGTVASVQVLDVAGNRWEEGPDLPEGRHHAAAAALDGTVYVTGGGSGVRSWTPERDVWSWTPGEARWEARAPLPDGRLGHRMEALDGRLYVVGGEGVSVPGAVLIYDPAADSWTTGAAMPEPRDHLGSAVVDGRIWAVGGRADGDELTDRVDVYDPGADRWEEGPAMPFPVSAAGVGVLDDGVHVVGGEDPRALRGGIIDRHLRYDLTGRWHVLDRPLLGVHGAGSATVGDRLVVAGGSRRQGLLSPLAWTGVTASYR
jgi:hypothetical protein